MVKRGHRGHHHGLRLRFDTTLELSMECSEEPLSTCQVESYRREKQEYDNAVRLVADAKAGRLPIQLQAAAEAEAAVRAAEAEKKQMSAVSGEGSTVLTPVMSAAPVPQQVYKFVNLQGQPLSNQWLIRPLMSVMPQQKATVVQDIQKTDFADNALLKRSAVFSDSYADFISPSKKKKDNRKSEQETSGTLVPLDEYYYGKKEGDPTYRDDKGEFRFKCWYCSKMLYNNVRTMTHMQGHIDSEKQQNLDLTDLTQCRHCYKQFDTPFEMQTHIEKVHMSNASVLMCRICEKDHDSRGSLTSHMRQFHNACEMPYICHVCHFRSSMYSDVVDHFKKKHDSSENLLCLYCLRVFHVKFVAQGWGMTQNYYHHLLRHQSKTNAKKCSLCKLTFFNAADVKSHKKKDHAPNQKGVIGINSKYMTPDQVMIRVPEAGLEPKNNSGIKSLNAPAVSKVKEHRGLVFPESVNEMFCFECKMLMKTQDHYKKYIQCSMCRFATSCSFAYANHMMGFHSGQMTSLALNIPRERQSPTGVMYCLCGFGSKYGNKIANHLVGCSKRSCYKEKPEVIPREEREEEVSDPRKKPGASLLDVLGLVKKPNITSCSVARNRDDTDSFESSGSERKSAVTKVDGLKVDVLSSDQAKPHLELTGPKRWTTVKLKDPETPTKLSVFLGVSSLENKAMETESTVKDEDTKETGDITSLIGVNKGEEKSSRLEDEEKVKTKATEGDEKLVDAATEGDERLIDTATEGDERLVDTATEGEEKLADVTTEGDVKIIKKSNEREEKTEDHIEADEKEQEGEETKGRSVNVEEKAADAAMEGEQHSTDREEGELRDQEEKTKDERKEVEDKTADAATEGDKTDRESDVKDRREKEEQTKDELTEVEEKTSDAVTQRGQSFSESKEVCTADVSKEEKKTEKTEVVEQHCEPLNDNTSEASVEIHTDTDRTQDSDGKENESNVEEDTVTQDTAMEGMEEAESNEAYIESGTEKPTVTQDTAMEGLQEAVSSEASCLESGIDKPTVTQDTAMEGMEEAVSSEASLESNIEKPTVTQDTAMEGMEEIKNNAFKTCEIQGETSSEPITSGKPVLTTVSSSSSSSSDQLDSSADQQVRVCSETSGECGSSVCLGQKNKEETGRSESLSQQVLSPVSKQSHITHDETHESSENVEIHECRDGVEIHERRANVETNQNRDSVEIHERSENVEADENSENVEADESSENVETCENRDSVEIHEHSANVETDESSENVEIHDSSKNTETPERNENSEIQKNREKEAENVEIHEHSENVDVHECSENVEIHERSENIEIHECSENVEIHEHSKNVVIQEHSENVEMKTEGDLVKNSTKAERSSHSSERESVCEDERGVEKTENSESSADTAECSREDLTAVCTESVHVDSDQTEKTGHVGNLNVAVDNKHCGSSSGHSGSSSGGQLDTNTGGQLDTNTGGQLDTNIGGQLDTNTGGQLDTNTGGQLDTNTGGQLDRSISGQFQNEVEMTESIEASARCKQDDDRVHEGDASSQGEARSKCEGQGDRSRQGGEKDKTEAEVRSSHDYEDYRRRDRERDRETDRQRERERDRRVHHRSDRNRHEEDRDYRHSEDWDHRHSEDRDYRRDYRHDRHDRRSSGWSHHHDHHSGWREDRGGYGYHGGNQRGNYYQQQDNRGHGGRHGNREGKGRGNQGRDYLDGYY